MSHHGPRTAAKRSTMPSTAAPLSPAARHEAISRLRTRTFDVLVIGGGVVGAGAALDAATRGLDVALVEARDFAAGTSSRSSKLIHGGLRYLEMLDFGLVAEALSERGLLIDTLAPHLIRPVPFLYPLKRGLWERVYAGSGLALYDLMASLSGNRGGIPWHRHVGRRRALALAPSLRSDVLTGALVYYDAQVDDARHTMFLSRTAMHYGAAVTSRTRVTSLVRSATGVTGATVLDEETGESFDIQARCVVNATGVWTGDVESMAIEAPDFGVRSSKGVHLVVPKDRIDSEVGMILRTTSSVLFVIPWGEHWIVGTTDTEWNLSREHPASTSTDIDYLLMEVNRVLRKPLSLADIVGVYAGLRPLLTGVSATTSKLSREHAVSHPVRGLVSVAGGKYTTYRVMARDAIDQAALDLDRAEPVPPSCTEQVPLLGAEGYAAICNQRDHLAERFGISCRTVTRLLDRYGSLLREVLAPAENDPTLLNTVPGAPSYLRAELLYAASHEGALHLDDVLTRRTRISVDSLDRGLVAAADAAEIVGEFLGWTDTEKEDEVGAYQARVDAERRSHTEMDDVSADRARYASSSPSS
jgi:glycerol-3-phosphate dehydrogenase